MRNPSGRRTIIRNNFTSGSVTTAHDGTAALPVAQISKKTAAKRSANGRIKSSTVAIYASVFVLLVSIISVGYRAPQQSTVASSVAPAAQAASSEATTVNDVVAVTIAANVARSAELSVAPNVAERAITTRVQSEYSASGDTSTIAKPAIVELSTASRGIATYAVVEGDTVPTVAAKFGITSDTIKWANNLKDDNLAVGSSLEILPRDGIAYTVKEGDTLEKLAEKYKADVSVITTYNDLEINGLTNGLKIVIPSGVLPETERPGYVAPIVYSPIRSSTGFVSGVGSWSGDVINMQIFRGVDANSGGYAAGNCTAYAYYRRAQLGNPVPRQLGNASSWATQARKFNHVVNGIPRAGAVIQAGNHVGVVEEVYPNGDLRITDMNYGYRVYNLVERIIPASTVHNYAFIH